MTDQNPPAPPDGGGYSPQGAQQPYPPGYEQVVQPYPQDYPQAQSATPHQPQVDAYPTASYPPAGTPQEGDLPPGGYAPEGYLQDSYATPGGYAPEGYAPPPEKKKGKAWIVLVIVLAIVLLGGGGAAAYFFVLKKDSQPGPATPTTPTATPTRPTARPTGPPTAMGGQSYTSPLGFTVTIPQGWSTKLEGNQEVFSNGAQDEKFAVVQVVDHGVKAIEPEAFMNDLIRKLQNDQGYRVEQAPQKVTFGSIPAVRARFGTQQNGYQVVVEVYAVKGPDGRLYQIQFGGSTEYFAAHLQDFTQFQSTFRMTGAAPTP